MLNLNRFSFILHVLLSRNIFTNQLNFQYWKLCVLLKIQLTSIIYLQAATGGVLLKKVFLKIFAKFTGEHLYQSLFFNKVAGPRPSTLVKKKL